jgi:hypothetical protein
LGRGEKLSENIEPPNVIGTDLATDLGVLIVVNEVYIKLYVNFKGFKEILKKNPSKIVSLQVCSSKMRRHCVHNFS